MRLGVSGSRTIWLYERYDAMTQVYGSDGQTYKQHEIVTVNLKHFVYGRSERVHSSNVPFFFFIVVAASCNSRSLRWSNELVPHFIANAAISVPFRNSSKTSTAHAEPYEVHKLLHKQTFFHSYAAAAAARVVVIILIRFGCDILSHVHLSSWIGNPWLVDIFCQPITAKWLGECRTFRMHIHAGGTRHTWRWLIADGLCIRFKTENVQTWNICDWLFNTVAFHSLHPKLIQAATQFICIIYLRCHQHNFVSIFCSVGRTERKKSSTSYWNNKILGPHIEAAVFSNANAMGKHQSPILLLHQILTHRARRTFQRSFVPCECASLAE